MERFKLGLAFLIALSLVFPLYGAGGLAQAGDPQEVQQYINSLKDSSWQIRWHATTALGDLKDPRGVEPLVTALKDENSYVRATAAWALGEIKDLRAIEPLIAALQEESYGVRKNAALALKNITGKDFGKDAALWQEWWNKNKK